MKIPSSPLLKRYCEADFIEPSFASKRASVDVRMIKLYASIREIKGTAYFELLPGPYRNEHWGVNSVFLDEETFGFIEPIFEKLCPNYGHYAFTEIGRPLSWVRGQLSEQSVISVLGL